MPRKSIVMIGTRRDVRGGISAVLNVYYANGLFRRWNARYIATHCNGNKPRKAAQALSSWLAFMALLLAGRVSLVHVHIASGMSFWRKSMFIVPAHLLRVPYVLHMHGGNLPEFYAGSVPAARRFIRWIYGHARSVIALSEEWRVALLAMQPASRVVVIPNPVEIPSWQARLDADPPNVLFLGVIRERKGVHDLLRAWPAVLRAAPEARLVLGGVGDMDQARSLARELGIERSIDMPGWITGDAKDALMKRAWVFALPSHYEALPVSVLEAQAAGIPVVSTRVGGIPTAVDDGHTGILLGTRDVAGLADAIAGFITDAGRRKAFGAAARAAAIERFSAEVLVPKVDAVWREIVPAAERASAVTGTLVRTD